MEKIKPHIKYKKLNWSYIHFAFPRQHFLKHLLSLTQKSHFYCIIIHYRVYIESFYNMFWIHFVFLNVCSLYFGELFHRLIRHITSISCPIPITCTVLSIWRHAAGLDMLVHSCGTHSQKTASCCFYYIKRICEEPLKERLSSRVFLCVRQLFTMRKEA